MIASMLAEGHSIALHERVLSFNWLYIVMAVCFCIG